jgi:hypothetical protein
LASLRSCAPTTKLALFLTAKLAKLRVFYSGANIPDVIAGEADVLPSKWSDMGQQFVGNVVSLCAELLDGTATLRTWAPSFLWQAEIALCELRFIFLDLTSPESYTSTQYVHN